MGKRLGNAALRGNTRMILTSSCLLRNPRKSLTASNKSFFQQPLPEPCISVLDGFLHINTYYTVRYAAWFPSFTHATKGLHITFIQKYCGRCGDCTISWMLWWFPGWVTAGVRWWCWADTDLGYSDGLEKRPADALEHYEVQGDLGFRYNFHASLYWHQHGQPSCVSPSSHTHKASWWLHIRIVAPNLALVFTLPKLLSSTYPMKHCRFIYITMESCRGDVRSSVEPSPCSLTVTSTLYLMALHQHVSTFPKHRGENWI
jgi:hypothetical protein